MHAYEPLEEGFQYHVGSGDIPSFKRWMDKGLLYQHVKSVHEQNYHLNINDVLIDGVWHWDFLNMQLP